MPSSVIAVMEYDPGSATLRIIFVSGMIYKYKNVPGTIYHALKTSDTKGIFLNQYIKGKYCFEKIN